MSILLGNDPGSYQWEHNQAIMRLWERAQSTAYQGSVQDGAGSHPLHQVMQRACEALEPHPHQGISDAFAANGAKFGPGWLLQIVPDPVPAPPPPPAPPDPEPAEDTLLFQWLDAPIPYYQMLGNSWQRMRPEMYKAQLDRWVAGYFASAETEEMKERRLQAIRNGRDLSIVVSAVLPRITHRYSMREMVLTVGLQICEAAGFSMLDNAQLTVAKTTDPIGPYQIMIDVRLA